MIHCFEVIRGFELVVHGFDVRHGSEVMGHCLDIIVHVCSNLRFMVSKWLSNHGMELTAHGFGFVICRLDVLMIC